MTKTATRREYTMAERGQMRQRFDDLLGAIPDELIRPLFWMSAKDVPSGWKAHATQTPAERAPRDEFVAAIAKYAAAVRAQIDALPWAVDERGDPR
jgi:hypothetical protein